jgi:hypothetical protein
VQRLGETRGVAHMQTSSRRTLGSVIFLAGVLTGLALAATSSWGDFEALSYFYTGAGYDVFGGLKCPIVMSRGEKAKLSGSSTWA